MTIRETSPDVNTHNPQGDFNSLFLRSLAKNIQIISLPWGTIVCTHLGFGPPCGIVHFLFAQKTNQKRAPKPSKAEWQDFSINKYLRARRSQMPTSAFLSLMPQVHHADKKAAVRTIFGFATARFITKFRNVPGLEQ